MRRLSKHIILLCTIVIALLFFLILSRLDLFSIESLARYNWASVPIAGLAFMMIYAIKAVVMVIPVAALYIAAGFVFPAGWAIVITYLCLAVELSIGYLNGKRLGENKVNELLEKHQRAAAFLSTRSDNLPPLCFVTRILPLPFDVVSMFFGAVKMPFGIHLLVSLLGLSPAMIPYVIAGANIENPLSPEFLVPFGISFTVTAIVFAIFIRITRNKRKRGMINEIG